MSDLTDPELASLVAEKQDDSALNELLERHSGIYIDMISKFLPYSSNSTEFKDLLNERTFAIWDAANTFDGGEKSQFHTWLANRTRYKCLTLRTQKKKKPEFVNIDDMELEDQNDSLDDLERKELMMEALNFIPDRFNERDCMIFEERFIGDKTQKDIAAKFDVKTQRVDQIEKKMVSRLKKHFGQN